VPCWDLKKKTVYRSAVKTKKPPRAATVRRACAGGTIRRTPAIAASGGFNAWDCHAIGAARQEKTRQLFSKNSLRKSNRLMNQPVAIKS
jgi:hypothetical protein